VVKRQLQIFHLSFFIFHNFPFFIEKLFIAISLVIFQTDPVLWEKNRGGFAMANEK